MMTKSWGDQYIAGPPNQKVGGDLSPPVPMVVVPMIPMYYKTRRLTRTLEVELLCTDRH